MAKREQDAPAASAEEAASPIAYRYISAGDFMPGIPARDLTVADMANLKAEDVEASGLYEKAV